ncbi:hypothetical protein SRABI13_01982 [Erwinia aphidicola]|nr:hypothetical protein SRABI13_01982 [Erwinia aphidicola]
MMGEMIKMKKKPVKFSGQLKNSLYIFLTQLKNQRKVENCYMTTTHPVFRPVQ